MTLLLQVSDPHFGTLAGAGRAGAGAPGARGTGLQRALWAVQAGTAVSDRVRAEVGNSVNVIRVAAMPRHGVVERWDHIAASERFECVAVHALSSADGP